MYKNTQMRCTNSYKKLPDCIYLYEEKEKKKRHELAWDGSQYVDNNTVIQIEMHKIIIKQRIFKYFNKAIGRFWKWLERLPLMLIAQIVMVIADLQLVTFKCLCY